MSSPARVIHRLSTVPRDGGKLPADPPDLSTLGDPPDPGRARTRTGIGGHVRTLETQKNELGTVGTLRGRASSTRQRTPERVPTYEETHGIRERTLFRAYGLDPDA